MSFFIRFSAYSRKTVNGCSSKVLCRELINTIKPIIDLPDNIHLRRNVKPGFPQMYADKYKIHLLHFTAEF